MHAGAASTSSRLVTIVTASDPAVRNQSIESACEGLSAADRLADLVPPPRKHRHRYHGVFAPNHKLRKRRHGSRDRQHRQAPRGRWRQAWERRSRQGRLL